MMFWGVGETSDARSERLGINKKGRVGEGKGPLDKRVEKEAV